jgi:phosphoribosylglycinamide formyltransferase-1
MNAGKPLLRLVLLTSRGGGHCMHIAEKIAAGAIRGVTLAAVLTENPQAPVIDKCRRRDQPLQVIPWAGAARRVQHEQAVSAALEALGADLVGLVGYLRLVGPALVHQWQGRLFNLHPSLLPAHPGLNAIDRAFDAGDARFGATVHWVDEGCDTGAHIAQRGIDRQPAEDRAAVAERVHRLEAELLIEAINRLATLVPPRHRAALAER